MSVLKPITILIMVQVIVNVFLSQRIFTRVTNVGKPFIGAQRSFRACVSKTRLTDPKNASQLLVKTQTLQDTRKFIVQRNSTNVKRMWQGL